MTEKITLPVQLATDLLEGGIGWTLVMDGLTVTVVAHQEDGQGRWESIHNLIIRREADGLHFAGEYRLGLTEEQDSQPWEDETEVTFEHVVPVTRTVTEYLTPEAAQCRTSA